MKKNIICKGEKHFYSKNKMKGLPTDAVSFNISFPGKESLMNN